MFHRRCFRKQQEIENGGALRADGSRGDIKLLTSCSSCLQGLSRHNDDAGTQADYIVVEMARHPVRRELAGGLRAEG